jgi:hypothetical protein
MDVAHNTSTCLFSARAGARQEALEERRSLHCYRRGTFECCGNTKLRLCFSRKLKGERALVAEIVQSLTNQIAGLAQPDVGAGYCGRCAASIRAARLLSRSSSLPRHCVAMKRCFITVRRRRRPARCHRRRWARLDSLACPEDILFAVDVEPHTRKTIKATQANKRSMPIVALTGSALSPRPHVAGQGPTDSPSFLYSLTSTLAAPAAAFVGEPSLSALRRTQVQRATSHGHRSQQSRAVRCQGLP